jgi:hypothetical protein
MMYFEAARLMEAVRYNDGSRNSLVIRHRGSSGWKERPKSEVVFIFCGAYFGISLGIGHLRLL